jgi:outer membrane protein
MKHLSTLFLMLAVLHCHKEINAQTDTLILGLEDIVRLAQGDAPDVQIAQTALNNDYWRFQSLMADFKPQISFDAVLPNLNRSIDAIVLPDGSEKFINRSLMSNFAGLSVGQNIPLTGGRLSAGSGLRRLDIFQTGGVAGSVSYLFSPIQLELVQPLFRFNSLKWDKRLAPLAYEEAKKEFSENMEQVAFEAARLFFEVLIAQLNLEAARRDKINADTLYAISKGRYDVGRIAETELLQIELSVMGAEGDLAANELNLQTSSEQLRNFLGIRQAVQFKLIPPTDIPVFSIDAGKALQFAQDHRKETLAFQRRILEAQRNVEQARQESGLNMDLSIAFGLSRDAGALNEVYRDFLDNERLLLSLNIPIADWGKTRSRIEQARSNESLTQLLVEQEKINFDREVIIKVQQFDLVRYQVRLADRTYEVAQKRLDITRQRYRIGNILVTDLNLAIREEAEARRGYINALRTFWLAYFELRLLTLYDFEHERALVR